MNIFVLSAFWPSTVIWLFKDLQQFSVSRVGILFVSHKVQKKNKISFIMLWKILMTFGESCAIGVIFFFIIDKYSVATSIFSKNRVFYLSKSSISCDNIFSLQNGKEIRAKWSSPYIVVLVLFFSFKPAFSPIRYTSRIIL